MPKFNYSATNTVGEAHEGVLEAPDTQSVISMLRSRSLYPTAISEQRTTKPLTLFQQKIRIKSLSLFCIQLSSVLKAGVPLVTSLDIIRDQVEDKAFHKILAEVSQKLQAGRGLTESFYPFRDRLPFIFMNMIEAGELSGQLDSCLRRAGETLTKQQKINEKVKAAMMYPSVLLVLTMLISVFLIVFIVPQFADMFAKQGQDLPATTQLLINIAETVKRDYVLILIVITSVIILFNVWLASDAGRTTFDHFKLRIPRIGTLLRIVCASRYTRTLSTMNAAGVPLTDALEVTAKSIGNHYLEKKILELLEAVRMGESMSAPLGRMKIFPPLITHMTRLGEESGTLDELLEQTADNYEEQSESAIAQLTALLEPAIIVVMGFVVLFVVLSILQPMFASYTMIG